MEVGVLVALIALPSGVVGAAVQHALSRRLESVKSLRQLRNEAYISFLKAMSGLAIARRASDPARELDFTIMLIESKARVVLYGDIQVITSMAEVSRHAQLKSPQANHALIALIKTMRRHGGAPATDQVSSQAIAQLLLGENEIHS